MIRKQSDNKKKLIIYWLIILLIETTVVMSFLKKDLKSITVVRSRCILKVFYSF